MIQKTYLLLCIAFLSHNIEAMENNSNFTFIECPVECPTQELSEEDALKYIREKNLPDPRVRTSDELFPSSRTYLNLAVPNFNSNDIKALILTLIKDYPTLEYHGIDEINILSYVTSSESAVCKYAFFAQCIPDIAKSYRYNNLTPWSDEALKCVFNKFRFIGVSKQHGTRKFIGSPGLAILDQKSGLLCDLNLQEGTPVIEQIIKLRQLFNKL